MTKNAVNPRKRHWAMLRAVAVLVLAAFALLWSGREQPDLPPELAFLSAKGAPKVEMIYHVDGTSEYVHPLYTWRFEESSEQVVDGLRRTLNRLGGWQIRVVPDADVVMADKPFGPGNESMLSVLLRPDSELGFVSLQLYDHRQTRSVIKQKILMVLRGVRPEDTRSVLHP